MQLVSIFDPPRRADFDFLFVSDAAGCLTPDRRSRAGVAGRCGRPLIFDLGRGPWRRPDARAWLCRARHPTSCLARMEHSPEPPPGEFTVFGSPVAGWMPLEVTPSPVTSLCCRSRGGGVVQAWLGLGYGSTPAPPQGIKWTTTCLPAMIFCLYTYGECLDGRI